MWTDLVIVEMHAVAVGPLNGLLQRDCRLDDNVIKLLNQCAEEKERTERTDKLYVSNC